MDWVAKIPLLNKDGVYYRNYGSLEFSVEVRSPRQFLKRRNYMADIVLQMENNSLSEMGSGSKTVCFPTLSSRLGD
jgi:hypothetical protein